MQKTIVLLFLIIINLTAKGQLEIHKFWPNIQFAELDTSKWILVSDNGPGSGSKGVLMFKHIPILDSLKRPVEPVIAIVYESISDTIDVIEYSVYQLGQKPFNLRKQLLGGYPEYSSDKHSVVFKGHYIREGVSHDVLLGYIMNSSYGIEIICDATTMVFQQVESDMRNFLKSVKIAE